MSQRRKRRDRFARAGDLVFIAKDCRDGGVATDRVARYEGRFDIETGRRYVGPRAEDQGNPRFFLSDGSRIYGCECFWTRLDIAKNVLAAAGKLQVYLEALREFHRTNEFDAQLKEAIADAEARLGLSSV